MRQRDPNWQPRAGAYEGVEGAIRYNEFRAREAGDRLKILDFAAGQIFVPNGFQDGRHINEFRQELRRSNKRAGRNDVETYIKGSAVTGESYKTGAPFNRDSDLELAFVSPTMFQRVQRLRFPLTGGGSRTFPLKNTQLDQLGILNLRDTLRMQMGGRKISIMIYRSQSDISSRKEPYEIIDHFAIDH